MTTDQRLLIVGCGYLGGRVAARWLDAGGSVTATTRSVERADDLVRKGIDPIVADVTNPDSLRELPKCDLLLYALGYDRRSGKTRQQVQVDGLRDVLDAVQGRAGQVVFISTTGVYSQSDGSWVDEKSPAEPNTEGGVAALDAERALLEHPSGKRSIILRLAGLYGPGRVPRRESIVRGEPITAMADGYLNLIHADDAASITMLAYDRAKAPGVFCVSDGHPVIRRDYFAEVARLYDAPPLTFRSPAKLEKPPRRGESNKRISNRQIMSDLEPDLQFPSFREGLRSIVANDQQDGA